MAAPLPPPPEPVIRAQGLSKTYGRGRRAVEALLDVDFELHPGSCLGLLGRNGSGKTTTIGLVLGLLAPSGGTVDVFGGRAGRRGARARTGYVPEEARRFGNLTGTETVALFAALQGVRPRRERRRRVADALDVVGLDERARRARVATYSRGMARRLALATSWVHRPDLLVLDEPTSGLDPIGTEDVIALLDRHRRDGGATLISTHDRVPAVGACDEILLLRSGIVAARGSPAELLAGDESASLASLLRGPTNA